MGQGHRENQGRVCRPDDPSWLVFSGPRWACAVSWTPFRDLGLRRRSPAMGRGHRENQGRVCRPDDPSWPVFSGPRWACAVSWTPFTPGWVTLDPCPGVGEGEVSALSQPPTPRFRNFPGEQEAP